MSKFKEWIFKYPSAPREYLLERARFLKGDEVAIIQKMNLQKAKNDFSYFSIVVNQENQPSADQKQKLAELKLRYIIAQEHVSRARKDANIESMYILSLLSAGII